MVKKLQNFAPTAHLFLGIVFFCGMMSIGYYYNLTFVQLGLVDLGERLVGMSKPQVAAMMAFLALATCLIALSFGRLMNHRGWGGDFYLKLRLALGVILLQTILTPLAPLIRSANAYLVWLIGCSLALGVGVPVTFSLAVDLVPRRMRGLAAGLITGAAYLGANLIPAAWTIEDFTRPLMWVMPPGVIALGLLASGRLPVLKNLVGAWAFQHRQPAFHTGRYARHSRRQIYSLLALMFGIYFVDSLGFLRLLDTPRFMISAWQSPLFNIRFVIGIVHVLGAFIGAVLYTRLPVERLFYWVFGIFALVHLEYTFSLRVPLSSSPALSMPALYALAVSLYTVINFVIWADISTPGNIGFNTALGVALSGWVATFISTGLALWWQTSGMPLERHLNIVNALALLFFLALLGRAYFAQTGSGAAGEPA